MKKILLAVIITFGVLFFGCNSYKNTESPLFDIDLRVYSWVDGTILQGLLCLFPNNTFVCCYYNQLELYFEMPDPQFGRTELGTFIRDGSYLYCSTECAVLREYSRNNHFILKEVGDDCLIRYIDYYSFSSKNDVDSIWLDWARQNLKDTIFVASVPPAPGVIQNYFIRRRPGQFDGSYKAKDISKIINKYISI